MLLHLAPYFIRLIYIRAFLLLDNKLHTKCENYVPWQLQKLQKSLFFYHGKTPSKLRKNSFLVCENIFNLFSSPISDKKSWSICVGTMYYTFLESLGCEEANYDMKNQKFYKKKIGESHNGAPLCPGL